MKKQITILLEDGHELSFSQIRINGIPKTVEDLSDELDRCLWSSQPAVFSEGDAEYHIVMDSVEMWRLK